MARLDFYVNFKLYLMIKLNQERIAIGRSADCDIILPDTRVSRVHAVIEMGPSKHWLHDRSSNGTRVNDSMVTEKVALSGGDRIYIEDFTLIYKPDGAEPEEMENTNTICHS